MLTFVAGGATAVVTDPGTGGSIDVNVLNNRDWMDVVYQLPAGYTLVRSSITDLAAEFTLSGPGVGSISVDGGRAPVLLCAPDMATADRPVSGTITGCSATTLVYRYWLSGQWGTGAVKLTFLPEAWSYQVTVGLPTAADTVSSLAPGNSTLVLQLSGLPSGWVLDTASWTALKALLSDAWTETTATDQAAHPLASGFQILGGRNSAWVITLLDGAVRYDAATGKLYLPIVIAKGEGWSAGPTPPASPTSVTPTLSLVSSTASTATGRPPWARAPPPTARPRPATPATWPCRPATAPSSTCGWATSTPPSPCSGSASPASASAGPACPPG